MRLASLVAILALLTAAASPAAAQTPATPKSTVLSVQPLNLLFEAFSGEIEHAIRPTMTVGVGGSYWDADEDSEDGSVNLGVKYTSGDLKLRYYPEGRPFQGFSFGGQVGYTSITGRAAANSTGESGEATVSGPTIGVGLDYGWLLGASKAFYVGLGIGAKRLFVDDGEVEDASSGYPTVRISVGFAF